MAVTDQRGDVGEDLARRVVVVPHQGRDGVALRSVRIAALDHRDLHVVGHGGRSAVAEQVLQVGAAVVADAEVERDRELARIGQVGQSDVVIHPIELQGLSSLAGDRRRAVDQRAVRAADRIDGVTFQRVVADQPGAVVHQVLEAVAAIPVGGGRIAEAAVGVEVQHAVGRARHQACRERIAVGVGIVGEHVAGDHRVLVARHAVGHGHRQAVDRLDVDRDGVWRQVEVRPAVGRATAVLYLECKARVVGARGAGRRRERQQAGHDVGRRDGLPGCHDRAVKLQATGRRHRRDLHAQQRIAVGVHEAEVAGDESVGCVLRSHHGAIGARGRVVDGGDHHRGATQCLLGTAAALRANVAVVEGPVDLRAGWRCIAAVGVCDLAQDVVDIGGRRNLAIAVGECNRQLARRARRVEGGDDLTVLHQVGTGQQDAIAVIEAEHVIGIRAAVSC